MKITCPGCNTGYTFNEDRMAREVAQVACKKCGTNLVFVKRRAQEGIEPPPIPVGGPPASRPDPEKRRRWTVSRVIKYAALGLIAFIVVGVLAVYGLFSLVERSDEYKMARAFVIESPEVKDAVGGRIDEGPSMKSFNVKTSGDAGSADMTFGVGGPAGDTRVRVLLVKEKGAWRVEKAVCLDRNGRPQEIAIGGKKAASALERPPKALPQETGVSRKLKEHLAVAHRLHREKSYKRAIEEYSKALALDPENPEALYWRGVTHVKGGSPDKGLEDLKKAVAFDPSNARAHETMGWLLAREKRYGESVESFTRLIGLKPRYAKAYYLRGAAHLKRGDVSHAMADMKRACELGYSKGCEAMKRLGKTI